MGYERQILTVKNDSGQFVNELHKKLQEKSAEVDTAESRIRQLEHLVKDLEGVVEKRAQNVAELDEQLADEREEGLQRQNQIHHLEDLLRETKAAVSNQSDAISELEAKLIATESRTKAQLSTTKEKEEELKREKIEKEK